MANIIKEGFEEARRVCLRVMFTEMWEKLDENDKNVELPENARVALTLDKKSAKMVEGIFVTRCTIGKGDEVVCTVHDALEELGPINFYPIEISKNRDDYISGVTYFRVIKA